MYFLFRLLTASRAYLNIADVNICADLNLIIPDICFFTSSLVSLEETENIWPTIFIGQVRVQHSNCPEIRNAWNHMGLTLWLLVELYKAKKNLLFLPLMWFFHWWSFWAIFYSDCRWRERGKKRILVHTGVETGTQIYIVSPRSSVLAGVSLFATKPKDVPWTTTGRSIALWHYPLN